MPCEFIQHLYPPQTKLIRSPLGASDKVSGYRRIVRRVSQGPPDKAIPDADTRQIS
jgi:hypothetical protein